MYIYIYMFKYKYISIYIYIHIYVLPGPGVFVGRLSIESVLSRVSRNKGGSTIYE